MDLFKLKTKKRIGQSNMSSIKLRTNNGFIPTPMHIGVNSKERGFTIVELIVSVAIFVIITSIILAKHSTFSGTLLVENLAYDIALTIRKAQVFGLSIKEATPGVFDTGYGVHFDITNNNSYIFFKDDNKNKKYDGSSEILETFILKKSNIISKFCGVLIGEIEKCSTGDITYLDILFERANPDAIIKSSALSDTYASAEITIISPNETQWKIETVATGQISIHK